MLQCPHCFKNKTRVVDSRPISKKSKIKMGYVRRRRQCSICGHKFTTYEVATR